ncbi:MipA/OmpV family protein [Rhodoferax sp.]|uniref:MipA/OmpV family protein n=1 Tax=Rhodoferax sp. TaxID=50421 RepID=UPI003BB7C1A1
MALFSAASWAQIKPTEEANAAKSGGYVVLGVSAAPRYQGADETRTTGIPGFEYHWTNGLYVGGTDGLVGFQLNATPQLQLGLGLGSDEGRKASDSRYLTGMGDVDSRGTLNMHAKAAINDQFEMSAGLQLGSGSSGKGGLLNLGASYGVSLAPATRMSFNVEATLANADYMHDYFGVSAAQASASGYKRYTPNSGLRDVTVGLGLQHQISSEWMLFTNLNSTTLSNAAKDSPLVRKSTSQSPFVGVAYSF